jgi:hypothetical protein
MKSAALFCVVGGGGGALSVTSALASGAIARRIVLPSVRTVGAPRAACG